MSTVAHVYYNTPFENTAKYYTGVPLSDEDVFEYKGAMFIQSDHENPLEEVFRAYNSVDGWELPALCGFRSFSVGDIVVLGEKLYDYKQAYLCRSMGWELVDWSPTS